MFFTRQMKCNFIAEVSASTSFPIKDFWMISLNVVNFVTIPIYLTRLSGLLNLDWLVREKVIFNHSNFHKMSWAKQMTLITNCAATLLKMGERWLRLAPKRCVFISDFRSLKDSTISLARFVYLHLKFKEHYKKMYMFSALLCVYQREGVSIPYYKLKYLYN
jgi:hypothetical protein